MPDLSASLTTLRADGHWLDAYLSVYVGALVLEAEIEGSVAFPQTTDYFPIVDPPISGAASAVRAGMRVEVYDGITGAHRGTTRVGYGGTISSTNLPVREHSRGYIAQGNDTIVRVYADIRLSDKLVTATADFDPDGLAYSDQGSNPPPIACSGGAWAGWDTMLPIALTGSTSIYVDPDSNGPLSHLWTYPTGLTGSSTTAADPNITAATVGEYLLSHRVTDDDNTKTMTQYVPIMVHDASNPPYDCVFESPEWNEESGGSVRVRVFENASLALIPDGAFVILWAEEYQASTRQSFGLRSSGRSHIIMTGYIRREEGDFDGESGVETLTFEIISPMARLDELVGYSKVMLNDATPNAWSEMKTLTTKRAIIQLIQFYSNLIEAGFDLVFASNYRSEIYPTFFLQEQQPTAQIRELTDGTSARFVCLRDGSFEIHTQPNLLAIGSRAAATVTLTLTSADILDWQYTREHWRPVKLLEVRGFSPGNSPRPLFSRWPGSAPGVGNESVTIERVIASTVGVSSAQAWMNDESGRRGGAADGIYVDADGVFQYALDLDLTLPASYWGVFEFYDEYIAITLTTTLRGLDLSDQLFVLRSKSFDYDAERGTGSVRVTLRTATNGGAGQTYVPPQEVNNGLPPDWTPPVFETPPVTPLPPAGTPEAGFMYEGTRQIAHFCDNGILKTSNYGDGAATGHTYTTYASLSIAGTFLQWVPNGYEPGSGWVVTSSRNLYYINLATLAVTTFSNVFAATSTQRSADASFGARHPSATGAETTFVAISNYDSAGGTQALYSTDNTTYVEVSVSTDYENGASFVGLSGCYVSPHTAGLVYTSAFTNTATFPSSATDGFVSTDYGATWSQITSPNILPGALPAFNIHSPFDADDSVTIYTYTQDTGIHELRRTPGNTNIAPQIGGKDYIQYNRGAFATDFSNAERALIVGLREDDATDTDYVLFTTNALVSGTASDWTARTAANSLYRWAQFAGNNSQVIYAVGISQTIDLSVDGGATWVSQQGNVASFSTGDIKAAAGF